MAHQTNNVQGSCPYCLSPAHLDNVCPTQVKIKKPYCRECGTRGHRASDCFRASTGEQSEPPSQFSRSSPRVSVAAAATAAALEEQTPSKPRQRVTHEALEKLYSTGLSRRNPLGENCKRIQDGTVYVSEASFHKTKVESFEESGLNPKILHMVKKLGYTTVFPIQKYAIAIIKSGRNLMASAQTGCGKSAAFLLPLIDNILVSDVRTEAKLPQYPKALIISPTRELAQQIADEATKFAAMTDLKIKLCYGKTSYGSEIENIKMGTNILVGTVGRTLDHLNRKTISLRELRYLVFDEADRLMEEDFCEAFDDLIRFVDESRCMPQTLLFSATYPKRIKEKLFSVIEDPVILRVGICGTVNDDVNQEIVLVNECDKATKLLETITEECNQHSTTSKILIFVRTKERAEEVARNLFLKGVHACLLHSDRDQYERTKALRDFNKGTHPVLVATLLASRGLDINLVNHVINYDLPPKIEEYVNSLGRTGRVGNKGRATSFFDPEFSDDLKLAPALHLKLSDAGVRNIPDFL